MTGCGSNLATALAFAAAKAATAACAAASDTLAALLADAALRNTNNPSLQTCSQRHHTRMSSARLLLAACCIAAAVAAAAADAAPPPAPAAATTQAGCACLAHWTDATGAGHAGCANPDGDPLGDWCAVDARACPGYYGSYAPTGGGGGAAAAVFYDYCGDVRGERARGRCAPSCCCVLSAVLSAPAATSPRCPFSLAPSLPSFQNTSPPLIGTPPERTAAGCLCAPEWQGEGGAGKAYRDRCAHPDAAGGELS